MESTNLPQIEFFDNEQISARNSATKKKWLFIISILTFILGSMLFLSFLSIKSTAYCIHAIPESANYIANHSQNEYLQKEIAYDGFQKCMNRSFTASNAKVILGVTINYMGILILSFFYLSIFTKNELFLTLGKAITISLILVLVSTIGFSIGIIGVIIASVINYILIKKILGSDMIGAVIFVSVIYLLNWLLQAAIASVIRNIN